MRGEVGRLPPGEVFRYHAKGCMGPQAQAGIYSKR